MEIIFSSDFKKDFKRIKDKKTRLKIIKQIKKLAGQPESGKPLKYNVKNHRCLRIPPFRIIYRIKDNSITVNCFAHRKSVYDH